MEVINLMVPVITIDGPASSGKGTVAKLLAKGLGFHYLESGAIYRALGLWVYRNYGDTSVDESEVVKLIATMKLQFTEVGIILNGENVTDTLREEFVGMLASKYGSIPDVRTRLLQFQRDFAKEPGLVTDGRDMGSVVFPTAKLKVFLTASAEKRAERRYKQLQLFNKSATIEAILQDIKTRDEQDSNRNVAPLSYDSSFNVLDNSDLSIEETIAAISNLYQKS